MKPTVLTYRCDRNDVVLSAVLKNDVVDEVWVGINGSARRTVIGAEDFVAFVDWVKEAFSETKTEKETSE